MSDTPIFVRCINTEGKWTITEGKIYKVLAEIQGPFYNSKYYEIENDRGDIAEYYTYRFEEVVNNGN